MKIFTELKKMTEARAHDWLVVVSFDVFSSNRMIQKALNKLPLEIDSGAAQVFASYKAAAAAHEKALSVLNQLKPLIKDDEDVSLFKYKVLTIAMHGEDLSRATTLAPNYFNGKRGLETLRATEWTYSGTKEYTPHKSSSLHPYLMRAVKKVI